MTRHAPEYRLESTRTPTSSPVFPRLTRDNFPARCARNTRPHHDAYLAMYSSLFDAVTTDPVLMLVPVDDHLVHRGDGVFETCKCVQGAVYNLDGHLERLQHSATAICLGWPGGMDAIRPVVLETVRVAARSECLIRILLSRGPGGFGINPYECPVPGLYVIVTEAVAPFMASHPGGARACRSAIPAKPPWMATMKNCNYLTNVLMKKEAVDAGVDLVVGFDAQDILTEGATENIGVVLASGELRFPRVETILCGTTMMRVVECARSLVGKGGLTSVVFDDVPASMVAQASELLAVGTTLNVTAICEYEGRAVGRGVPGPVWRILHEALWADMTRNLAMRTDPTCRMEDPDSSS